MTAVYDFQRLGATLTIDYYEHPEPGLRASLELPLDELPIITGAVAGCNELAIWNLNQKLRKHLGGGGTTQQRMTRLAQKLRYGQVPP